MFLNRTNWKLNILAGHSKNELAWYGELEEQIDNDKTTNANSIYDTDKITQGTIQIQNDFYPNTKSKISSSIYYTLATGFWDDDNNKYYFSSEMNVDRTSINSHLFGFYSNYRFNENNKYSAINYTVGFHGNTYSNNVKKEKQLIDSLYKNTHYKKEASMFFKIEYRLDRLLLFSDIQYRYTSFYYNGDVDFGEIRPTSNMDISKLRGS